MDIDVFTNLVDKLYYQEKNKHLNSIQINLLRGVWLNQSYEEIAKTCYCSIPNVKIIGSELWKLLSQILGEKVTKKTVRAILESYCQDLKTGKSRTARITIKNNNNLPKTADSKKITQSEEKYDSWFDSEILFRLTERLDNSLKAISNYSDADVSAIKSLSEKLQLIHHLSREKYSLNRDSFDIINICRCLINDFKVDFPNREIILSLFEDPILPYYDVTVITFINENLVKNILKELLFNALQYSSAESSITLDINVEDQKGIFSIIDQGMGIPSDELDQVFQPFYCATNAGQKSRDGLGLTIVEKSVRLHQGEIYVSSQIKQGSTFTVVLPVA